MAGSAITVRRTVMTCHLRIVRIGQRSVIWCNTSLFHLTGRTVRKVAKFSGLEEACQLVLVIR